MEVASRLLDAGRSGGKLSNLLYTIATNGSRVDKDLADISGDIALTSTALTDVGSFFGDRTTARLASDKAYTDAQCILDRCHESFGEIQVLAGEQPALPGATRLDRIRPFVIPFRGAKLELLKKRLESLKCSLILLLSVLKFSAQYLHRPQNEPIVQQQRQGLQQLLDRHRSALDDVHQLELRLGSTSLQADKKPATRKKFKWEAGWDYQRSSVHTTSSALPPPPKPHLPTISLLTGPRALSCASSEAPHAQLEMLTRIAREYLLEVEHMTKVLQQSAFPDRAAYVEHNIRHQSALLVESLQRYLATPTFRSYPPPPPPPPPQQPPESPKPSDFGIDLEAGDLNFSNEDPEVLENFDFDSFLHNTDAGQPFESFDFMNISLETEKPATEDPRSRTISPEPMEVRPQPTAKELPKKCQPCRARRIECDFLLQGPPCTNCRQDDVQCTIAIGARRLGQSRGNAEAILMFSDNGLDGSRPDEPLSLASFHRVSSNAIRSTGPEGHISVGMIAETDADQCFQMHRNVVDSTSSGQDNASLQDFQMQMMLLEEQNKKRLFMARQETDHMTHVSSQNHQRHQQQGTNGESSDERHTVTPSTDSDRIKSSKRRLSTDSHVEDWLFEHGGDLDHGEDALDLLLERWTIAS